MTTSRIHSPAYFNTEYHPVQLDGASTGVYMDVNSRPGQPITASAVCELLGMKESDMLKDFFAKKYNAAKGGTLVAGNPWYMYPVFEKFLNKDRDLYTSLGFSIGKEYKAHLSKLSTQKTDTKMEIISEINKVSDDTNKNILANDKGNEFLFINKPVLEYQNMVSTQVYADVLFKLLTTMPDLYTDMLGDMEHIYQYGTIVKVKIGKSGELVTCHTVNEAQKSIESDTIVIKNLTSLPANGKSILLAKRKNTIEETVIDLIPSLGEGDFVLQICPYARFDEKELLHDQRDNTIKARHARAVYLPDSDDILPMINFKLIGYTKGDINNSSAGRDSVFFTKKPSGLWEVSDVNLQVSDDKHGKITNKLSVNQYIAKNIFTTTGEDLNLKLDSLLEKLQHSSNIEQQTKINIYDKYFLNKSLKDIMNNLSSSQIGITKENRTALSNIGVTRKNSEALSQIIFS